MKLDRVPFNFLFGKSSNGVAMDICSDATVISLSVCLGFFGLTSVVLCALRFRSSESESGSSPCPYCAAPFQKSVLREHLQVCSEHLEFWSPKRVSSRTLPTLDTFYYKPVVSLDRHINRLQSPPRPKPIVDDCCSAKIKWEQPLSNTQEQV